MNEIHFLCGWKLRVRLVYVERIEIGICSIKNCGCYWSVGYAPC